MHSFAVPAAASMNMRGLALAYGNGGRCASWLLKTAIQYSGHMPTQSCSPMVISIYWQLSSMFASRYSIPAATKSASMPASRSRSCNRRKV